jgi:hypothetical protein
MRDPHLTVGKLGYESAGFTHAPGEAPHGRARHASPDAKLPFNTSAGVSYSECVSLLDSFDALGRHRRPAAGRHRCSSDPCRLLDLRWLTRAVVIHRMK